MADDVKQPAGKAADLARVRDNQRRSRARRKEYLQELEMKYRTCEQIGIGASAEIQAAARQVANENKRLRQILQRHGISTDELDGDQLSKSVAGELEAMIGKKRMCGGDGASEGFSSSTQDYSQIPDQGGLRPLQSRAAAGRQLSPASGYESSNNSAAGGGPGMSSPMGATALQQQQQQLHPAYVMGLDTAYTEQHHQQQQQQQTPSTSLYGSYEYPPPPQQQHHHQQTLDQDFYTHSQTMDSSYAAQSSQQQQQHQQQHPSNHNNNSDSSSCRDIAAAIRYVRPNISQHDLEREMGCQPGASETAECHVPNYEAFDLMDRLGHGEGGVGGR